MLDGEWGTCVNRPRTPPAVDSFEKLRNKLCILSDTGAGLKEMFELAGLARDWTTKASNTEHDFTLKHRNWWIFHHLAAFKQNPAYFQALGEFMNPKNTQSYFCDGCQAHFHYELIVGRQMTDEEKKNVVLALWYLHNQAQWEITSGKQKRNAEPHLLRHQKWTYMPTPLDCPMCRTPKGWNYNEVQRHLYTWYKQTSECIHKNSKSECPSSCYWNDYWDVCQEPVATSNCKCRNSFKKEDGECVSSCPSSRRSTYMMYGETCQMCKETIYELVTSGTCGEFYISSKTECEKAATDLDMDDKTASYDNQNNKDYDPKGCYFEKGKLKLNKAMSNTGECSENDKCLCYKSIGPVVIWPNEESSLYTVLKDSPLITALSVIGIFGLGYGIYTYFQQKEQYEAIIEEV